MYLPSQSTAPRLLSSQFMGELRQRLPAQVSLLQSSQRNNNALTSTAQANSTTTTGYMYHTDPCGYQGF